MTTGDGAAVGDAFVLWRARRGGGRVRSCRVTAGAAERSGRTAPFLAVQIGKLLGRGADWRRAADG